MTTDASCGACDESLAEKARFEMRAEDATEERCLRCAILHAPTLWRSARVAAVVGTFLVVLNQGDKLAALGSSGLAGDLFWKIPLTYLVPFCVATYGALGNARQSVRD